MTRSKTDGEETLRELERPLPVTVEDCLNIFYPKTEFVTTVAFGIAPVAGLGDGVEFRPEFFPVFTPPDGQHDVLLHVTVRSPRREIRLLLDPAAVLALFPATCLLLLAADRPARPPETVGELKKLAEPGWLALDLRGPAARETIEQLCRWGYRDALRITEEAIRKGGGRA